MPKVELTEHFVRRYLRLPKNLRTRVDKALTLLSENPRHPSLQTKAIRGMQGIFEARVDLKIRLTYERLADDTLLIRTIGSHDETLKKP
jgi:mRNA interferase RelE/StbE